MAKFKLKRMHVCVCVCEQHCMKNDIFGCEAQGHFMQLEALGILVATLFNASSVCP